MFFGSVSFIMKSAPGTGIVSSAILQSDDLDEVDWEFLGGVPENVQTNYFSKGNTKTYDRQANASIPSGNSQTATHNYTIYWTKVTIEWIIDGAVMRTVSYAQVNDAYGYPQTPMNVRIGIWAGGDPTNSKGTIEWAGGETNYKSGPYTMTLQKIEVINASPGGSYEYGDKSGSWQSIKVSDKKVQDKFPASLSASVSASASASPSSSASAHKSGTQSSHSPQATGADKSDSTKDGNTHTDSSSASPVAAAAQATSSASPSAKPEQSNDAGVESVQWKFTAILVSLAALVLA